jgi:hypothetical protein
MDVPLSDTKIEGTRSKVPRGILGSEIEKAPEGWRKLHHEELHNLFSSPITIKVIDQKSQDGQDM